MYLMQSISVKTDVRLTSIANADVLVNGYDRAIQLTSFEGRIIELNI